MEIIIRSRENGWETERRMELPEDDGLVKSILRSVKRRTSPPQKAGGVTENKKEERSADAPPAQEQPQDPPASAAERTVFETGYKGFLILTCAECGRTYTVNAQEAVQETVCKACGHVTELMEMAAVEMRCPDCGRIWRYRTNSEQAEVTASCIKCGARMVSEWNSKFRRYVPRK